MSTNADSVQIPLAPGTIGSGDGLWAIVASVWRRRLLVLGIIAAALVVGIITIVVMPARYEARAYIRGELFAAPSIVAKDNQSMTADSMALDLLRVIETQTRVLESNELARRVVRQLGLEQLRPLIDQHGLLPALFGGGAKTPEDEDEDEVGIAAASLLGGLSVESDPRAYLIAVRYKAGDPEFAKLIANTFVAELLRSAGLQTLFKRRSIAQDELSVQLAKFGNKHPGVARASIRLEATDELLSKKLNEPPEAILQAAGENVTRAISAPSSPTRLIIALLFGGFAIGVGVALWLERGKWM